MSTALAAATLATALACALVAGVFFAFSSFVMPALGRLAPDRGIAAMQSINRAAVSPAFMAALFGAALGCVAVGIAAALAWGEDWAPWALSGGGVYAVGAIGLTLTYHVPRNEALADIDAVGAEAVGHWRRYLAGWTAWNHVRAVAALAGAAALTVALHLG